MMSAVRDGFLDLERHRQLLQDNSENLCKSLRHWQLWEAEYEGLKEEILAATSTPMSKDLNIICNKYDGELLTKEEINDILGNPTRDATQVINLLDRRIDYVGRNVSSIQKQVLAVEKKLAATSIDSTPEGTNKEDLPMTEILETLDDQGNVISSQSYTASSMKPQLLEVLRKAGVKDLPVSEESVKTTAHLETSGSSKSAPEKSNPIVNHKKSVSFANVTNSDPEYDNLCKIQNNQIVDVPKNQENQHTEPPIIPCEESAEDAALRHQMLQYGMLEVGSVVAQLEIEDKGYSSSNWSDNSDEEKASDSDEEDEEDNFGRYTGRTVTDELRQHMIELEERLGNKVMRKFRDKASVYETVKEDIGCIAVQDEKSQVITPKKTVRFSEDLDISSNTESLPLTVPARQETKGFISAPISDVIERIPTKGATSPANHKMMSHLKNFRSNLNYAESARFNRPGASTLKRPLLAPTIIERETSLSGSVDEPDEMDPNLLRQEVASEYYKIRNMMIQRQGGFLEKDENERIEFTEEEGGPKKLSRFKAARLKRI